MKKILKIIPVALCIIVLIFIFTVPFFSVNYLNFFNGGPFFSSGDNPNTPHVDLSEGEIYALLEKEDPLTGTNESVVEITEENFRTLVAASESPKQFIWETEIKNISGTKSLTEEIRFERFDSDRYELEISLDGILSKVITDNGKTVSVTEYSPPSPPTSASYPTGTSDPFLNAGLPTSDMFLSLPEDAVGYSFTLGHGEYGNIAKLEFSYSYGSAIYKELYEISLDHDLVTKAETYENGVLVYELKTISLVTN